MKKALTILFVCTFTIILTSNSVFAAPMTRKQLTDAILVLEQGISELGMRIENLSGTVEDEVKLDIEALNQDMADLKKELKKLSNKVSQLRKRQSGTFEGELVDLPTFELKKRFKEDDRVVVVTTAVLVGDGGLATINAVPRVNWLDSNYELSFRISAVNGDGLAGETKVVLTWIAVAN